jgi:hypothetical protein
MKHEPTPRTHAADEVPATVIHDYGADDTLLAKWLRHAMDRGPSFWVMVMAAVIVALGLGYFVSGLTTGQSANARAWGEILVASSPEDFQRVAETASGTSAGHWAALKAASTRFRDGLSRLPADRETANPILTQALEGFQAIEQDAKDDPTLRRLAMVGIARTYETRDELSEAIVEYEKVAAAWPDSEDGKQSAERAKFLRTPEAESFYKTFASFKPGKPSSTTIGPRGSNRFDLPAGHPPLDGPLMPAPSLIDGVSPGSISFPSDAPPSGDLPKDVFQKNDPAKPKGDAIPDVFPDEPAPKPKDDAGKPK